MVCPEWNACHANLADWQNKGIHNTMVQAIQAAQAVTEKSRFSLKIAYLLLKCQVASILVTKNDIAEKNEKPECSSDLKNDLFAFSPKSACGKNEKTAMSPNDIAVYTEVVI